MENVIVSNSERFIKEKYPEVEIDKANSAIIFDGRFVIHARKGSFEIHEAPHLRIVMSRQYPRVLPQCYDVDKKIKYDHVFDNGALCVSTILDLANGLKDSVSIQDYIDKFIIPYFLSYRYWEKTGKDLNGDRAHGTQGIYDSLREYLDTDINNAELKCVLCWAAKIKKFKKCVPKSLQKKFLALYLKHIKKLRQLDIWLLRKQCKQLTRSDSCFSLYKK